MTSTSEMNGVRSESDWRMIVEGRASSDLTISEYCASVGVTEHHYYKWRNRFLGRAHKPKSSKKPAVGAFTEITSAPVKTAQSPWVVELSLLSGVTIRVRG